MFWTIVGALLFVFVGLPIIVTVAFWIITLPLQLLGWLIEYWVD